MFVLVHVCFSSCLFQFMFVLVHVCFSSCLFQFMFVLVHVCFNSCLFQFMFVSVHVLCFFFCFQVDTFCIKTLRCLLSSFFMSCIKNFT